MQRHQNGFIIDYLKYLGSPLKKKIGEHVTKFVAWRNKNAKPKFTELEEKLLNIQMRRGSALSFIDTEVRHDIPKEIRTSEFC